MSGNKRNGRGWNASSNKSTDPRLINNKEQLPIICYIEPSTYQGSCEADANGSKMLLKPV